MVAFVEVGVAVLPGLVVCCLARSRKTCKQHRFKSTPRTTCMTMGRQVPVEAAGRKACSEEGKTRHEIGSAVMPQLRPRVIAAVRVSSRSIGSEGTPSENE